MMKKYFVCSDIHGFYTEWMLSLKEAGFDTNNNEHILIILGDIFDRGSEPWKVYKFIRSLPEERIILVKGNHEYLLLELVERKYACEHDVHNGTYDTLISLSKDPYKIRLEWLKKNKDKFTESLDSFEAYKSSLGIFERAFKKLFDNKKINEIVEWIKSPKWLNYYELGQYIFVHSFIPLLNPNHSGIGLYFPMWREQANEKMWYEATWGCPWKIYQNGCFKEEEKNGKILVCGHWHTSDIYNNLLYKNEPSKRLKINQNPIFKSELFPGLIGIDACTALTRKVNTLVIHEEELNQISRSNINEK